MTFLRLEAVRAHEWIAYQHVGVGCPIHPPPGLIVRRDDKAVHRQLLRRFALERNQPIADITPQRVQAFATAARGQVALEMRDVVPVVRQARRPRDRGERFMDLFPHRRDRRTGGDVALAFSLHHDVGECHGNRVDDDLVRDDFTVAQRERTGDVGPKTDAFGAKPVRPGAGGGQQEFTGRVRDGAGAFAAVLVDQREECARDRHPRDAVRQLPAHTLRRGGHCRQEKEERSR